MEYRKLGSRGPLVSAIGFGAWAIGGHGYGNVDDAESARAVARALDLGVTLFDTADVYGFGHSEEVLGRALQQARHNVVIATKFGVAWDVSGRTRRDSSPAYVQRALDASLRRLNTDYIDLYQVHWPDPETPLSDTMDALQRALAAGKIRHIGVSNFTHQQIADDPRVVSLQALFNMIEHEAEADLLRVRESGIGRIAYCVLARGLLSGKFAQQPRFAGTDTRATDANFSTPKFYEFSSVAKRLAEIAARHGATAAQIAIRWAIDHPAVDCALVGAKTDQQIIENVHAGEIRLSPHEWSSIAAAAKPVTAEESI